MHTPRKFWIKLGVAERVVDHVGMVFEWNDGCRAREPRLQAGAAGTRLFKL